MRLKFAVKRSYGRVDVRFPLKCPNEVIDAEGECDTHIEVDNRGDNSQNIAYAQFPRVKTAFFAPAIGSTTTPHSVARPQTSVQIDGLAVKVDTSSISGCAVGAKSGVAVHEQRFLRGDVVHK